MPRNVKGRIKRLRSAFNADGGSMPLALFLVVFILAAATTIASSVTWQIANNRNEVQQRTASWGLESASNRAAQNVGATGRFLRDIPNETPTTWTISEDGTYVYRWWVDPVTEAGPTKVATPPRMVHTASDGTTLLGLATNNKIYISTDSTTWIPVGNSPLQTPGDVAQVTYEQGYFYIVPVPNGKTIALTNGTSMRAVYRSANGVDWSSLGSPGQVSHADKEQTAALDCSSNACVYVATVLNGNTRPTSSRYFVRTSNGWELAEDSENGSAAALAVDVAYSDGTWVAIGANNYNQATVSVSLDNGITWSSASTYHSGSVAGANVYPTQVEHVGTKFVALQTSTVTLGQAEAATDSAWTSTNGVTWNQTQISSSPEFWQDITSRTDGSLIAAVPGKSGQPGNAVYMSATGTGWTTNTVKSTAWTALNPIGPSWLLQGPSDTYAVPTDPEDAGLPDRINVNVQVLPVGISGSYDSEAQTPYQSTAVYDWDPSVSSWQISAYFHQTTVIPSTGNGTTVPSELSMTVNGPTSIYLTWTAPTEPSTVITGYRIQYDTVGTFSNDPRTFDSASLSTGFALSGLNPATRYYARVAALGTDGNGDPIVGKYSPYTNAMTTTTTPDAPLSISVTTPVHFAADLSWPTPPSDGGSAITSWEIQYSTDINFATDLHNITSTSTGSTYRVVGLLAGTHYYFRVAAVNSEGTGEYSPAGEATVN